PAGFILNPDGSWSLDAANAAYQHIAAGATQDVVVNYTVTDEHGAKNTRTHTSTPTSIRDATAANDDAKSGAEDTSITGSVATNASAVDDALSLHDALPILPAGFILNPDGSWSLDAANAAYQHIAAGATQDVVVNYTVTDEHGA